MMDYGKAVEPMEFEKAVRCGLVEVSIRKGKGWVQVPPTYFLPGDFVKDTALMIKAGALLRIPPALVAMSGK